MAITPTLAQVTRPALRVMNLSQRKADPGVAGEIPERKLKG